MARISEAERLMVLSEPDRLLWKEPGCVLAGMDEVGRGPLAGPVVAACIVMPQEPVSIHI